ncbi:MAG: Gfo/Idh/MocA family oxidoreductase [Verrucomicrobia bacterium]|nr:Gfo/Idh/MocA family oxidoreductase [Verrucomicrobiota bacterium]
MKSIFIIGAGDRGSGYAAALRKWPERVRIVGVAEPREAYREAFVREYGIPADNVFACWRGAAERERFADAVLICTQDALHADPAVAFARKGYHILLEKPMATTADDCRRIVEAVEVSDVLFAVCHVLRYTPYTHRLKDLIARGRIGDPVSIQHLEPVGYAHQAHSFVRGNWRNEAESTFMLLAKSCHDLDWLSYVMGQPIRRVSSFGSLFHFRPENRPANAAQRCTDCALAGDCLYSAGKVYSEIFNHDIAPAVLRIVNPDTSEEALREALRTGPYGRCVYACDNDVVDHQVVNMEFGNGTSGVFTMTAFTEMHKMRQTRIFGTRGQIVGDGESLDVHDFLTDTTERIAGLADSAAWEGHGGADQNMIDAFVDALESGDQNILLSGPEETLMTHLAVFAAEQARREKQVVEID